MARLAPLARPQQRRFRIDDRRTPSDNDDATAWTAGDEEYRLFAAATEEGIVIHDFERILAVNGQLSHMFGYADDDMIGADPFNFVVPGEDAPLARRLLDDIEFSGESLGIRADGSIFPIELKARTVTYRGKSARIVRIHDLTRRRQVEATLNASEERFRATFEQAAVGIAHVAIDGTFLRVNQRLCQIVGYTRDELLEQTFQRITHPDDLDADLEQLQAVLAGTRDKYAMEKRYFRKDGTLAWANLTVSLVRSTDGLPDYFISIVEDIGARKTIEDTLRQSQKMEAVGQLTSSIAHDFGNFLNVIKGNLQLLEPYQIGRRPADYLKSALAGTELAEKLIRQLLSFSRRQEPEFEILDINVLIHGIEDLLRRAAGDGVNFTVRLSPLECLTNCDRGQLESAMFNLVANARDALPDGKGDIAIETAIVARAHNQVPRDYIEITVTDNGHGMPTNVIARATEPFFTTKDIGRGTGLGLSQVARGVAQVNGIINIESSEGIGTTIRLFLPRHQK